jgi:hypothetical protein
MPDSMHKPDLRVAAEMASTVLSSAEEPPSWRRRVRRPLPPARRWLLSPAAAPESKEEIPGTRLLVCFLFRDPIDFAFSFQGLDCILVL